MAALIGERGWESNLYSLGREINRSHEGKSNWTNRR